MQSIQITPRILYFGTPVVILSTLNPDDTPNLSVLSSAWSLGQRVILGLGVDGQGILNLERTSECVLNLPSSQMWEGVERIAPTTGRDPVPITKQEMGYRFEANKFGIAGFTPLPSATVSVPRIAECPLQLEARLLKVHAASPPEDRFCIVETEVTQVHAHTDLVIPTSGHIDPSRWNPLLYVFRHYFGTGAELGRNFRAEA